MRYIVFDLETQNYFSDVGSNDPANLDISVACFYDSATDKYTALSIDELSQAWPIIEQADALVGYNSNHFDIPLLNKYYPGDLSKIKSIDLMREVQTVLGRRLKLDTVGEATLNKNKSGHGLDAIEWWRNGEIEKIIQYCIEDVRLTRNLYDFAKKNGLLKYKELGATKEIKLDTSKWESVEANSMTYTLPF